MKVDETENEVIQTTFYNNFIFFWKKMFSSLRMSALIFKGMCNDENVLFEDTCKDHPKQGYVQG